MTIAQNKERKFMRSSRRLLVFAAALSLVSLVSGCGGGGGGTSTGGAIPLATRLRQLQPGDSHDYSVRSIIGSTTASGTIRAFLTSATIGDVSAVAQNIALNVQGQTSGGTLYYSQDPSTGDVYLIAGGDAVPSPEPAVIIPGTWQQGVSFSRTIPFADGTQIQASFAVIGTETVRVPAGTFETWKTTSIQRSETFQTSGTYWWVPQLGNYVKAEYTTTFTGGQFAGESYEYSLQLTSTNVPLR